MRILCHDYRANIHAAISTMASLGEPSIPAVYLTKQALDGITIGDKQFIYGVLRHVMQVCVADDARACQSPVAPIVSPPPRPPTEQRPVKSKRAPLLCQGKPKITSLFLDVPACQLVEEECRDGELATLVSCQTAPWDAMSLMDGVDDIVPTASRRLPAPMEETEEELLDIVPLQRVLGASVTVHDDQTTRHLLQSDRSDTVKRESGRTSYSNSSGSECIASQTAGRVSQDAGEDVGGPTMVQEGAVSPTLGHQRGDAADGEEAVVASTLPAVATEVVAFSSVQVNQVLSWLKQLGIELADAEAFHVRWQSLNAS
jgi:hypothetical protein